MLVLAANVVDNTPSPEVTRGDVAALWVYLGIGIVFIVVLVALIMWYRHRAREEGNVNT
jgi:flagellar biosynthesis/type III secretory pathway M-ring protein FliF/YscJ